MSFERPICIPGLTKIHVIKCTKGNVNLWINSAPVQLKTGITALNRGKSVYLTNLLEMLDILESDSYLSNKIFFICFNESPLKMMGNAFYYIL